MPEEMEHLLNDSSEEEEQADQPHNGGESTEQVMPLNN